MKLMYKLIALLLVAAGMLSILSACEKQDFFSVLREAGEMTAYDYEVNGQITLPKDEGSYTARVYGHVEDAKHLSLNVDLKEDESVRKILEVYFVENALYVNLRTLLSYVTESMGAVGQALPFEGDFYKISLEDLPLEDAPGETEFLQDAEVETLRTVVNDVFSSVLDVFQSVVKEVTPAPIKADGRKFVLTVNDKNLQQIVNRLGEALKTDFDGIADRLIADYETKGGSYAEIAKDLKEARTENDAEIKEGFQKMAEYKYEEKGEFELSLSVELTGKAGRRTFASGVSFRYAEPEEGEGSVSLSVTKKECSLPDAVKVPENLIPAEQVDQLGTLLGSLFSSLISANGVIA